MDCQQLTKITRKDNPEDFIDADAIVGTRYILQEKA